MTYVNKEKNVEDRMSAEDVAVILSQTMKDVAERKTTLRQAMAIARLALALSKTIETADLSKRVEFLEHVLKRKK
jgi:hypothetical protein